MTERPADKRETRCPTCGSDGVKACADEQGRDMDLDHEGRPPFFPPGFDRIWRSDEEVRGG